MDIVVLAARIHNDVDPIAQALGITGERIVALGSRADAHAWVTAQTRVVDLGAGTVTAGLADPHSHPLMGLDWTRGPDLGEVTDVAELSAVLSTAAAALAPQDWLIGWNFDGRVLDGVPNPAALLDEVSGGRKVFIRLLDGGHSVYVSSAALHLANISGPVDLGPLNEVVCDESGRPTGLLHEEAVLLVEPLIVTAPLAERITSARDLFARMAASGLTAVHALDFSADQVDVLRALDESHELPLFYRCSPVCEPQHTSADWADLLAAQTLGGKRWQVEGIKFYLDGTIDNGTAWLKEPDKHGAGNHSTWRDPAAYRKAVTFFAAQGIPTATHAIGDAAIEYALDALAPMAGESTARHRIEHIETLSRDQAARFGQTGVIASMQPSHCTHTLTADQSDNWSQRLGPSRALRAFPQRDILDSGGTLAFGSDWPIGPFDPREIMAAARLRRPAGQPDTAPIIPKQAVTAEEALLAYTQAPALIGSRSADEGAIGIDMYATITAFATDPLALSPDESAGVPVVLTMVRGTLEFVASPAGAEG